ncbi:MAG: family 16 glycoside hydrolase [candidate division WOR-3 bacterium]
MPYFTLLFILFIGDEKTWHLANHPLALFVSKDQGKITAFFLNEKKLNTRSLELLVCGKKIESLVQNWSGKEVKTQYQVLYGENTWEDFTIRNKYLLDSSAFTWQVTITPRSAVSKRLSLSFDLPLVNSMDHLFDYEIGIPVPVSDFHKIQFYRRDFYLPVITLYNSIENIGLSIIVDIKTPKPALSINLTQESIIINFDNLTCTTDRSLTFTLYLLVHEADFRPALKFLLEKYPEYFQPVVLRDGFDEGWFYQTSVFDDEDRIKLVKKQNVKWVEFHCYFPFYGLYVPPYGDWGLIFDSDEVSLHQWQSGGGRVRTSLRKINELIALWHRYDIQVYLYFQPFEAWHQYATKYFSGEIARDQKGQPLPAWKFCNLMNPDPNNKWGKYITEQAKQVLQHYPTIDGIFYDRMDYHHYDFSHHDGYTSINGRPAYMLAFALEKINSEIFEIFHRKGKVIWGNGPTSIEVCKNLDGIMAEGNLSNLFKLQYLCATRPLVYLPYDATPRATEKKLKYALLCGAFPALSYGDSICQLLEKRYQGLFELIKNRKWVLSSNPIVVPKDFRANIFQTPEGDYVGVVISPQKTQLLDHPYEYNIPITINTPDASQLKYLYLLSSDWPGIVRLSFKREKNKIKFSIPAHLTTSVVYLSRKERFKATYSRIPIPDLEPVSCAPVDDIYIKFTTGDTVLFYFANNTGEQINLKLEAQFIDSEGIIKIPEKLLLGKFSTRTTPLFIAPRHSGKIKVRMIREGKVIEKIFPFRMCLTPEPEDLFYDEFKRGMEKWQVIRGTWNVEKGAVRAKGESHLAFVLNKKWKDYVYEVKTRMLGSENPFVDWLKSYLFFRVQDVNNFYRFGIHGDAGTIDLYKCINGEWKEIASALFEPEPNKWYVLRIEALGPRIIGYLDGEKILEVMDNTFDSGGIGLGVLEDGMVCEYREVILKNR